MFSSIAMYSIKHQSFVYTQLNDQTVLFQTIQLSTLTKLNDSKYCYVSLTVQLNISYLFTHSWMLKTILFSISAQLKYSIPPIDRTLSDTTTLDQSGPGSDGKEGVLCIPQSSSITRTSPSDCLVSYLRQSLAGSLLCWEAISVFCGFNRLDHDHCGSKWAWE